MNKIFYEKKEFIELPEKILNDKTKILKPQKIFLRKSLEELLKEALKKPIASKTIFKEKMKKAALIFSDNTRIPSPYIPKIIEILEKIVNDLKIIVACGTHEPPPKDFIKKVLGEKFGSFGSEVIFSSTKALSNYEFIGKTFRGTEVELNKELLDRDFIVSSLCVRPHYFAGFEGGAKALLPGCSSHKTIIQNHSRVIGNKLAKELVIKGNPIREDINEIPSLLFNSKRIVHRIIDFIADENQKPIMLAYGEPVLTHTRLAELCTEICTIKANPSSIVITVADGPMGKTLYQSLKAFHMACNIAKKDSKNKSIVVLIASMKDGLGNDIFTKELSHYYNMPLQKVMEDLKERAKKGDFNETLQKINRISIDKEYTE
ncbi:MAG: lactate racemase domain-containing protein, partial [Candidatus Bathyarchaeia archaeon]